MEALSDIDKIFAPFSRSDAPGLVIGVARAGVPIYRRAFGMASLEHGVANSCATLMPLASITKQFTAFAALLLAEDGLLDLDQGVRTWIPELPLLAGDPSLRQLLEHRSGYRCYLDAEFASGYALRPAGAALAFQVRQSAADYPPGERQVYNNSGYFLLSLVIERASGLALEDVLHTRVFRPLGMWSTRLLRDDSRVHVGVASTYEALQNGQHRPGGHVAAERLGDGAVYSTIDDMLRWLAELRGPHALGSTETWRQYTTAPVLPDGIGSRYALGLQVKPYRGQPTLGHGGALIGARAYAVTFPEQAVDIVILSNTTLNVELLAQRVADIAIGEDVLAPIPARPRTDPHRALLGLYHSPESGRVFRFADCDGTLGFSYLDGPAAPLAAAEDARFLPFAVPTPVGEMRFEAAGDNQIVVHDGGGSDRYFRVSDDTSPVEDVLAEAAGRYRCEDVEAVLNLRSNEAGGLRIDTRGPYGRCKLTPVHLIARDLLASERLDLFPFPAVIALTRDPGGRVSGLTVTTARTRRLPFVREAAA